LHEFFDKFRQTLPLSGHLEIRGSGDKASRAGHRPQGIGKFNSLARFLLGHRNVNDRTDMRNTPFNVSGMLVAATIAMPAFAFLAGCGSTSTGTASPATQLPQPAPGANDDASLAARVKIALASDPGLRPLPVSVATYRGVVQLSGYVDTDAQLQQAIAVARSVPGVQSVNNDLYVRPK
jgi:hyperosmotically inducible periplasmic protein